MLEPRNVAENNINILLRDDKSLNTIDALIMLIWPVMDTSNAVGLSTTATKDREIILGISGIAHDAAVAVIQDGRLVFAVEEERISRRKDEWTFPHRALDAALKYCGLNRRQVSKLAFYWDDRGRLGESILGELRFLRVPHVPSWRRIARRLRASGSNKQFKRLIREYWRGDKVPEIVFCEHHLAHMRYAYDTSGFDDAVGVVIDGRGENASISIYRCAGTSLQLRSRTYMPASLGYIYAAITQHLGFAPLADEYRVMGLAPYGKYDQALEAFFARLISFTNNEIKLDYSLLQFQVDESPGSRWLASAAHEYLGEPRGDEEEVGPRHADIAYALQARYECIVLDLLRYAKSIAKSDNLVLAGGCAMNSVCNGKIVQSGVFSGFFVPPAPGDQGAAIGAGLIASTVPTRHLHGIGKNSSPFLGPEYSDSYIRGLLAQNKIGHVESGEVPRLIAKRLADGEIGGIFSGRMEFGARALGNRSILADPRKPEVRDKVNAAIKFREAFRPFAASVLKSHVHEYLGMQVDSHYMNVVGSVSPKHRELLGAVTHIDGSCRFHSITQEINPFMHSIVSGFFEATGVPLILNTSFNVKGEPIVMTPEDAIRCFFSTGLDFLAFEKFIICKHKAN